MLILENRTIEEAIKYFNESVDMYRNQPDMAVSEVYALAIQWKRQNIPIAEYRNFELRSVCLGLIKGEL